MCDRTLSKNKPNFLVLSSAGCVLRRKNEKFMPKVQIQFKANLPFISRMK